MIQAVLIIATLTQYPVLHNTVSHNIDLHNTDLHNPVLHNHILQHQDVLKHQVLHNLVSFTPILIDQVLTDFIMFFGNALISEIKQQISISHDVLQMHQEVNLLFYSG